MEQNRKKKIEHTTLNNKKDKRLNVDTGSKNKVEHEGTQLDIEIETVHTKISTSSNKLKKH